MPGYTDAELKSLVHRIEQSSLHLNGIPLMNGVRNAFQTKPFSYGTQGKKGGGLRNADLVAYAMNDRKDNTRPQLYSAEERGNFPDHNPKKFLRSRTHRNAFDNSASGYAFQTGPRQFNQRQHGYQMMDMYYGDGKNVGTRADPFILEFVNYAAKFKHLPDWNNAAIPSKPNIWETKHTNTFGIGQQRFPGHQPQNGPNRQGFLGQQRGAPAHPPQRRSPWEQPAPPGQFPPNANTDPTQRPGYMHPFFEFDKNNPGTPGQGWKQLPSTTAMYGQEEFRINKTDLSLTKELSRIIRWCIKEFGGTIVFEGADVYYDQVFNERDKFGDTDLEATDLFQYFKPGLSETAYGNGKIIFEWHSKKVVPSKLLFLTTWVFDPKANQKWYNLMDERNFASGLTAKYNGLRTTDYVQVTEEVSRFKKLFGAKPNVTFKATGQTSAPDVAKFVEEFVVTNKLIWDNFMTFPVGVTNETVKDWIKEMMNSDYRNE